MIMEFRIAGVSMSGIHNRCPEAELWGEDAGQLELLTLKGHCAIQICITVTKDLRKTA